VQVRPEPNPALSRSCDGGHGPFSQNARRAQPLHPRRGPDLSITQTFSARTLALFGGAAALGLLLDQPAQAHGIAHGGIAAGFLHPISGADHLLLLIGVGTAASCISAQLLLWALAGAVGGGVFGAMGGTLPAQEFLAALAISAVAVLVLRCLRSQQSPQLGSCAALVASAVAVPAMLHGLEAPADGSAALWWLGAFAGSVLVSGGSFLLLRRLPLAWTRGVALLLALCGGVAALGPIGLLMR
jgi:urease accessory protein